MTDIYTAKATEILNEASQDNSAHPIGLRKHQIRLIAAQLRAAGKLLKAAEDATHIARGSQMDPDFLPELARRLTALEIASQAAKAAGIATP